MEEHYDSQDDGNLRVPWIFRGLLVVPSDDGARRWSCRTTNGRVLSAPSKQQMRAAIDEYEDTRG